MPMPSIYHRLGFDMKVEELIREGVPKQHAVGVVFALARKAWRKKHPRAPYPEFLREPAKKPAKPRKPKKVTVTAAANPVPASSRARLQEAARLYENFSGHDGEVIAEVERPEFPSELIVIGECDGIMYSTIRDGVKEKYIHKFHHKARPMFCVTHDGTGIFFLGGEYDFTERGIVDRTDPKQQ